jgi:hypothetical protein
MAVPFMSDSSSVTSNSASYSVGLEEGQDGWTRAHALHLLGCAAEGEGTEAALDAFASELAAWLRFLGGCGERVPPPDAEIELAVDEWIRTDVTVGSGESHVCFEADFRRLTDAEIDRSLRRLGDLRGRLLDAIRGVPDGALDQVAHSGWTPRQILEELARAQWWTLSRLGASPMAEVPTRTLGRLDTAAALVVDRFTSLPRDSRGSVLELEGQSWTPRKVLRRLLWIEWSLGGAFTRSLQGGPTSLEACG